MKSSEVRKYVLDLKRKFGDIKTSTILGRSDNKSLGLHELASQPIHQLRLLAKSRADAVKYKYIWLREGNIFVRRDDNSYHVPIITKADLDRLL